MSEREDRAFAILEDSTNEVFDGPSDIVRAIIAFADAELERIAHEVDSYLMTKTSLEVGHIVEVATLIRTR